MKFTLSDVYQAILAALIRFWDARFQEIDDPILSMLRLEIEHERREKKKLLDIIAEIVVPAPLQEQKQIEQELKPLGVKSWQQRARELEADARERRRKMNEEYDRLQAERDTKITNTAAVQSVESLEQELAISDGAENA